MAQRLSFFPKADAAVLQTKYTPPVLAERPTAVAPIFDAEHANEPLEPWGKDVCRDLYPEKVDIWAPAPIPTETNLSNTRYLFPVLTRNERLRLTMLFYYTHGALEDAELVSRLQEKVHLARESIGWEFVIAGLLDHNTYTRMVTVGLPLAILPRRESTCAHTVNQPPGAIFTLLNMIEDWRFRESPHVEIGGLRAYAGAPLRFQTDFGEHVAFGSLCVASNTKQEPLSKSQQVSLARLADWIVADIVQSARVRRQRERRRMMELIGNAQKCYDKDESSLEEVVLNMLRTIYPKSLISIQETTDSMLNLEGRGPIASSELDFGLWEDCDYFDYLVHHRNHQALATSQVVRIIAAECEHVSTPTFLVVASKDFRLVFDDVDAWFVQSCATMLSRGWHSRTLKEALRVKDEFLRGMTHQLRTPIHGILGSVELLTEELKSRNIIDTNNSNAMSPGTPGSEQLNPDVYLRTIQTSARELISTVNGMLKLNRWTEIASADRVISLHHIQDVERELVHEALQAMPDDPSRMPSLFVQYHLPPNSNSITTDLRLLIDSLQPLIVNAIQNTTHGVVNVTISITDDFQLLNVDVEDTGSGISPSDWHRIFDPYVKVDPHTTGAGLGLTLATKVASLIDGSITLVSSEPGKGSHFRATFSNLSCSCSFPPPVPVKNRFHDISLSFCLLPSSSALPSLSRQFSIYLTNCGFAECGSADASILLFEYVADALGFSTNVPQLTAEQVAICLKPALELSADFGVVRRDNNIVYVKGPFTSSVLELALVEAHAVLSEQASAKARSIDKAHTEASLEPLHREGTNGHIDDRPQSGSALPSHAGSTEQVVRSFQKLDIKVNTQYLVSSPPSHVENKPQPMALLVDDNSINLRLMQMYCSKRGIQFCSATDGRQAIDLFQQHQSRPSDADNQVSHDTHKRTARLQPFNLVLMDLQMPVCDGIEACCKIRALEQQSDSIKSIVFIVTGQDSPSDRSNAEEAGADGYFVKPVGPKVLDRGIRKYFQGLDAG